jgi:hypothetical protein
MKLAAKKKLLEMLRPAGWTGMALVFTALGGALLGPVYYNNIGSRGEPQARAAEAQEVGNAFTRTAGLKEQYDKYASRHRDLAAAAQNAASPEQQKMAQTVLEAKYAYEKSVAAQTVQITHARDLSIADIQDALDKLVKEHGGQLPPHIHELARRGSVSTYLHLCQKELAAATPGFTPSPDSAKELTERALDYNSLSIKLLLGLLVTTISVTIGGCVLDGKLRRSITQEEHEALQKLKQEQEAIRKQQEALAAMPPPPKTPPAPFDPATGEDITVKPIKIKAPAAPAGG